MSDRADESDDLADLVAVAADEFRARVAGGETPDPEEYAARHPAAADILRRVLGRFRPWREEAGGGEVDPAGGGRLGDYRIVREVGRGGMGVVYEAEQISLRRRVALKVLPFAAVMDPRQLQRFKNEALAAAGLDHPNVVKVYGVGCERGVHFIAMQFIDGRTLADLIRERRDGPATPRAGGQDATRTYAQDGTDAPTIIPSGPRTVVSARAPGDAAYFRRVAEWGASAADALEHAHEVGVVHRDIKPGNLLVDAGGKLFVADFGLAKVTSDPGVTGSGDLLGTLRYMSPEQAGARHDLVDHRSDIYSLGVTLYELLTLTPAFDGTDRQAVLTQVLTSDPVAPRKVDRSIPRDLETVILKAMEKDPSRRYPSAKEFAEDLRRVLGNEPVKARRATFLDRVGKWAKRHRAAVWSGVALLALTAVVASAAAVVVWQQKDAKDQALRDKTDALAEKSTALELRDRAVVEAQTNFTKAEGQRTLAEQKSALVEKQRKRLEANFRDTMRVFGDLYFSSPPNPEHAAAALTFFRKFIHEKATDPAERLETGLAYGQIGLIHRAQHDYAQAADAYAQARRVFKGLTADFPNELLYQDELARAQRNVLDLVLLHCLPAAERLVAAGRYQDALPLYRQALVILEVVRPDFPDTADGASPVSFALLTTHRDLGNVLHALGQPQEAEQAYARSLTISEQIRTAAPVFADVCLLQQAEVYIMRGRFREGAGSVRDAETDYRQALTVLGKTDKSYARLAASRRADAESALAWLLATAPPPRSGKLAEAVELASRAVEGFPKTGKYQTALGAAHYRAGDWKAAVAALQKSMELTAGGGARDFFFMAMARHRLGEKDEARKWYDRAVESMEKTKSKDEELRRFRAEAAELLGIEENAKPKND